MEVDDSGLSARIAQNMSDEGIAMASANDVLCEFGGHAMKASSLLKSRRLDGAGKCIFPSLELDALKQSAQGCSRGNGFIYEPRFADIVDDIAMREHEPGVRKCVVSFNEERMTPAKLREYDDFLERKFIEATPEYKALYAQYVEMRAKRDAKQREYDGLVAEYNRTKGQRENCQVNELPSARSQLASLSAQHGQCIGAVPACLGRLAARRAAIAAAAAAAVAAAAAAAAARMRRGRGGIRRRRGGGGGGGGNNKVRKRRGKKQKRRSAPAPRRPPPPPPRRYVPPRRGRR